jgi:hypothetical protein
MHLVQHRSVEWRDGHRHVGQPSGLDEVVGDECFEGVVAVLFELALDQVGAAATRCGDVADADAFCRSRTVVVSRLTMQRGRWTGIFLDGCSVLPMSSPVQSCRAGSRTATLRKRPRSRVRAAPR